MAAPYIHELPGWPDFTWDTNAFALPLARVHFRRGALITAMASLGFDVRQDTVLSVLVQDVTKSSEIEGEHLDEQQVRSSIAQHLGMDIAGLPHADRDVEGVVQMMLDATQRYDDPLDAERLFSWHAALFPTGRSHLRKIIVASWRDDRAGPMLVLSGREPKQKVHYQAPDATLVPDAMQHFLSWFEEASLDPVVQAAVAHLWFVTIHPFDDGNGRIARALTDLALARADGTAQRFYSMSAQLRRDRKRYYEILEKTQKGGLDITAWITWFIEHLQAALDAAQSVVRGVRNRQAFWDAHHDVALNTRQIKMLNKLLDGDFKSKLQTQKYAAVTGTSAASAKRDLADLVHKGILMPAPGTSGRGTHYLLITGESSSSCTW
ncbi:Fic family protein [Deinococcus peraridilitoris]|nr:Fic family protein [Deinococcus peraridilitoris]